MSDDRSMITQFEAAQVAKFDELYRETLKNSKIKVKNIKTLSAMCARLIDLDTEERILGPIHQAQRDRLFQLSHPRTKENWEKMRKIHSLRSYRRWGVVFDEICDLRNVVHTPFWENLKNDLFKAIIHRTMSPATSSDNAYLQEYIKLDANWAATIVENTEWLLTVVNCKLRDARAPIEKYVNPGDTKTLAAKYHANPTPGNAATYAEAIRALQVDCSICLDAEDFFKGKAMPQCRHVFHEVCLWKWVQHATTCPLCRTPITDVFAY